MSHRTSWAVSIARFALVALVALTGCKAEIGDKCVLSTDCSTRNDRQCDTSQPGGYCTTVGCGPNSCPDEASCVLFGASPPGCPYDDRATPRLGHSFCMRICASHADCREGYTCRDPRAHPISALVLDDIQDRTICMAIAGEERLVSSEAPNVCRASSPSVVPIDASAGEIVARDAATDPPDAGAPADAGGTDAAADAADGH